MMMVMMTARMIVDSISFLTMDAMAAVQEMAKTK